MINVVEYEDEAGNHPYSKWFASLNVQAALKVRTAVACTESSNFSNTKGVGRGVIEYKLDFGPGYRIIEFAQTLWKDYKRRKKEGK